MMGRLFTTLPLFSTDYSAAASAIRDCGGLAVICCPDGCMGNYVRFDEPRWAELPGNVLQLEIMERDVIFGEHGWIERFRGLEIPEDTGFIGLVNTPVSSLVGLDTSALCREIEEELGIRAVDVSTNGYGTHHDGVFKAMRSILDIIPEGESEGVAVLGFNSIEHTDRELKWVADTVGTKTVFPGTVADSLTGIRCASMNVLMSSAATSFARMMESKYGIPYEPFMSNPAVDGNGDTEILIVGEQFRSNNLRNEIRIRGHDADIVSFFTMDDRFSESGDAKIRTESELSSLISEGYRCVVGDPLIRGMVPPGTVFIEDPQSAISSRLFRDGHKELDSLGELAEHVVRMIW